MCVCIVYICIYIYIYIIYEVCECVSISISIYLSTYACMHAKSLQLCLILCNPMDCSPPSSSAQGFSRQEYWSQLPCFPPGALPDLGMKPTVLKSPVLTGGFFTIKKSKDCFKLEYNCFTMLYIALNIGKTVPSGILLSH